MQNNHTLQTTTHIWEYHILSERCSQKDIGTYLSFGIHAFEVTDKHIRAVCCVHDVTTIQSQANDLAELCNRFQLSPIHLKDFIDDYLAKIS